MVYTPPLIFLKRFAIFSSSNGRFPHSSAYRITPQLQISTYRVCVRICQHASAYVSMHTESRRSSRYPPRERVRVCQHMRHRTSACLQNHAAAPDIHLEREGGREEGREAGTEGGTEGGREGGREGGMGRESIYTSVCLPFRQRSTYRSRQHSSMHACTVRVR
jgi:hypothetical protein